MKYCKKYTVIIAAAMMLMGSQAAKAFDPSSLFSGQGLSGLGNTITSLIANDKFDVNDLVGTWDYSDPAVTFESDNALQKIGGAAAATTIEEKIEPYYERFGMTALKLIVNEDLTFTMKLKKGQIQGTISKDEENGRLVFDFKALKKIKFGRVEARATKAGSTLILTFDMSKLIPIIEKISSLTNSSSATALSKILSSYDGLYAGFKLKEEGSATTVSDSSDSSTKSQESGVGSLLNSILGSN